MALSSTGIVTGQIINASDVLQYYSLFTGVMADQAVTFKNALSLGGGSEATTVNKLTLVGTTSQTGAQIYSVLATGDSNPAWKIDKAGTVSWGAGGSSAVDNTLSRGDATFMAFSQGVQIGAYGIQISQVGVTLAAPATGFTVLYSKNDGNLYYRPHGGAETALASGGSVTSVALTVPTGFAVSGSPITTSGTLAITLSNQAANLVFAGPTSGGATTPTFRGLVAADIPSLAGTIITSGVVGSAYLGTGSNDSSHFLRGDGTWATIAQGKTIIATTADQLVGATTTIYYSVVGASVAFNANEVNMQVACPFDGTIKNAYLTTYTTQSAGGTFVATLRKNTADTTVVITVGISAGAGTFSDTSHSVVVAAGDLLSWKLVNNGSGNSAALGGFSFELDPS